MTKEVLHVDMAELESYAVYLKEKSRPPSRGGNQAAWHAHVMTIGGESYSFLATWSGKFVHKGERATFDWSWDETGKYRNVDVATVFATKPNGDQLWRGERGQNKTWRTADTRPREAGRGCARSTRLLTGSEPRSDFVRAPRPRGDHDGL